VRSFRSQLKGGGIAGGLQTAYKEVQVGQQYLIIDNILDLSMIFN